MEQKHRTELIAGIHAVKAMGHQDRRITLPKPVAASQLIGNGAYVLMMEIGPCIILTRATQIDPEGAKAEIEDAFERAIAAWHKQKGANGQ